jgi:hypothetical protein
MDVSVTFGQTFWQVKDLFLDDNNLLLNWYTLET